ncbi:MAG: hypothetical protein ACYCUM_12010 [Solirubrobacteraceae bacterium]
MRPHLDVGWQWAPLITGVTRAGAFRVLRTARLTVRFALTVRFESVRVAPVWRPPPGCVLRLLLGLAPEAPLALVVPPLVVLALVVPPLEAGELAPLRARLPPGALAPPPAVAAWAAGASARPAAAMIVAARLWARLRM